MFNTQKTYFKKRQKSVQCTIWDLQFKRFKTLEVREEIRQVYDQNKAKLQAVETTIKQQNELPKDKRMKKEDLANLQDQTERLKRDIARYEAQMKAVDIEVHGSKQTNEYPDGVNGMDQQLEALQELKGMLGNYIKNL